MDYKKTNAPLNTQTRDLISMSEDTGNVYETVCIIAKRSNQIAGEMKHDLEKKLQEFASLNDNLEEISENREQIEISRFYERLPKPPSSQPRNISTTRSTSATLRKTTSTTSTDHIQVLISPRHKTVLTETKSEDKMRIKVRIKEKNA